MILKYKKNLTSYFIKMRHSLLFLFLCQVLREAEEELAEEEEERRRQESLSRSGREDRRSCSGPEDLSDVELDLIGDFMVKESLDVAAGRLSASPRPRFTSHHSMVFLVKTYFGK